MREEDRKSLLSLFSEEKARKAKFKEGFHMRDGLELARTLFPEEFLGADGLTRFRSLWETFDGRLL